MKRIALFSTMVFCLSFVSAPISAEELIGRVNEWPPFYFKQDGKWVGSNVDAYMALSRESGVKIVLKMIPWSRAMKEIKDKPIIIGQLNPTEERGKIMHFIGPHTTEDVVIGIDARYLDEKIDNLDDLAALARKTGKKIGYQQDVFYTEEFNKRVLADLDFRKHFEKKAVYETIIKMVEAGRLAGFLNEKITLVHYLKRKKSDFMAIHPYLLNSSDVYFGVSRSISADTLAKLVEANKRLIDSGVYKDIDKKWASLEE